MNTKMELQDTSIERYLKRAWAHAADGRGGSKIATELIEIAERHKQAATDVSLGYMHCIRAIIAQNEGKLKKMLTELQSAEEHLLRSENSRVLADRYSLLAVIYYGIGHEKGSLFLQKAFEVHSDVGGFTGKLLTNRAARYVAHLVRQHKKSSPDQLDFYQRLLGDFDQLSIEFQGDV